MRCGTRTRCAATARLEHAAGRCASCLDTRRWALHVQQLGELLGDGRLADVAEVPGIAAAVCRQLVDETDEHLTVKVRAHST